MSIINKITYQKIKKNKKCYTQTAFLNNKVIQLSFKNLTFKHMYRDNNELYINILLDKKDNIVKIFDKIKKHTIKNVWGLHKANATFEEISSNYIDNLYEKDYIKLKINKFCHFQQKNQKNECKNITFDKLEKNDIIDIFVLYKEIKYGKSNFTNNYIVNKIAKHVEEPVLFHDCQFEVSENEEEIDDIDYNEEINSKLESIYINL